MTSILFCSICADSWKCNGLIECPWLSPHDEANCSQQCSSLTYGLIPCDCNKPGNMACGVIRVQRNNVCYSESSKFLVLCYFFVNVTMINFGNV